MASPRVGSSKLLASPGEQSLTSFVGFLVVAGLLNSLIAAFLLSRLPEPHTPSLIALFARAFIYVSVAALTGTAGAWLYWRRSSTPSRSDPPLSFRLFALTNAAGWVWVPSIVLLSTQDSPASAAITILGGAILATGLRKTIPTVGSFELGEKELFAASLQTPPREVHAYVIAVCIYAAFYSLHDRSNLVASALFAPCAFFIAWKLTLAPEPRPEMTQRNTRTALRLATVALPAIIITFLTLMMGVDTRNHAAANANRDGTRKNASNQSRQRAAHGFQSGIAGYESIILWPVPEKKQIVFPLPSRISPFDSGTAKPLVIRFDGPYWYFQPPGKRPGPKAHMAHGNPLAVNIKADNSFPLTMEADQHLGSAIRLARCREIQVSISNRDNRPGAHAISLGLLLTDSASSGKPAVYLGQQSVVSSEPAHFSVKTAPVNEVLHFPIPDHAKIRRFDEITVIFLPDAAHFQVGPKIAIQQFELLPR